MKQGVFFCGLFGMGVLFPCGSLSAQATDLIISEYVEGSGNNKYLEVYNGTGAVVNLTDYQLRLYSNGSATPSVTATLAGTLNSGAVVVYKNSGGTIYAGAATVNNTLCNYNGDDALALWKISTNAFVDIFGKIGCDPGAAWTSSNTTVNQTLVRKLNVCTGITTNPGGACNAGSFPTLDSEWDQFPQDDASNLGSHAQTCLPTITFATPTGSAAEASGNIIVTMNISPAPLTAQSVTITMSYGAGVTYGAGGDHTTLPATVGNTFNVPIPANSTSVNFTLVINDDAIAETNETITAQITGSSAGVFIGNADTHVHTIVNDDFNPTIDFSTVSISAIESGGVQIFQMNVIPAPVTNESVTIQINNGPGAVYTTDYVTNPAGPGSFVVSVPSGVTSVQFSVAIVNDVAIEADETITFSILSVSAGLTVGTNTNATLTIIDNDSPPTILGFGDLVIVGVNANNGACSGQTGQDEVSFFCFKDIVPNTTLDLTDCGYEYANAGQWGDNEGAVRITRNGPTIPAGQVITLRFNNTAGPSNVIGLAPDAGWTCQAIPGFTSALNLNVSGDQIFFMQSSLAIGAAWTNPAGASNAVYNGTVLYGFSTNGLWLSFQGTTQHSGLPLSMECFSMGPTAATDWSKYTGPQTPQSQRQWIIRIDDPLNWTTSYGNCGAYNASTPDWTLAPTMPITLASFIPGLWTGAKSIDWFNCQNWDDARVPVATTDVVIDQTGIRSCEVNGGLTAVCNDLNITTSGTARNLTIAGASTLNAGGDITIQRTAGGGTVNMYVNSGTVLANNLSMSGALANQAVFWHNDPLSTVIINGDVNLFFGGMLDMSSGVAGGTLTLGGDFNNAASELAFDDIRGTLVFNGPVDQGYITSGFQDQVGILRVVKPGGDIFLVNSLRVRNSIDLVQGRIMTTATDLLSLNDAGTVTNASNTAFVHGPMQKFGTNDFQFPIGKGNTMRPASLTTLTGNASSAFTAEYFAADPQVMFGTAKEPTLDHISACEYWTIDRSSGAPNATVTLTWDTPASCGVTLLPDLRIARWDGSLWLDRGNGGTTGNTTTGSIITPIVQTQFSPWTLASVTFENPLPVELLNFRADVVADDVLLRWATATERDNARFIVERSMDGNGFSAIGIMAGAGNSLEELHYQLLDEQPLLGHSYYRLVQEDFDGTRTISDPLSIWMSAQGDRPLVLITTAESLTALHGMGPGAHYELMDMTGRIIASGRSDDAGSITVPLAQVPHGAYLFRLRSGDRSESERFVR